ncbi:MAG: hypothetical protein IKP42_06935 [Ruminococcus sp.]|nr:hypothetical protein [Ruminococcus sp.]
MPRKQAAATRHFQYFTVSETLKDAATDHTFNFTLPRKQAAATRRFQYFTVSETLKDAAADYAFYFVCRENRRRRHAIFSISPFPKH